MARTTLDLDDGVLRELKKRRERENRPIGAIASELLARALADQGDGGNETFTWTHQPMGAKVDIDDREALWAILDRDQ